MEIFLEDKPEIHIVEGYVLLKVDRTRNKYIIHQGNIYDLHYISHKVIKDQYPFNHVPVKYELNGYYCDIIAYKSNVLDIYIIYKGEKLRVFPIKAFPDGGGQIDLCNRYGLSQKQYPGYHIANTQSPCIIMGRSTSVTYRYPINCPPKYNLSDLMDGYVPIYIYIGNTFYPDGSIDFKISTTKPNSKVIYSTWIMKKGIMQVRSIDPSYIPQLIDIIIGLNKLYTPLNWKGFEDVKFIQ